MTKQEQQVNKLKKELLAEVDDYAARISAEDKKFNCKLVEWNAASNDENDFIGLYYIPFCTKTKQTLIDSTTCEACEFRDRKYDL